MNHTALIAAVLSELEKLFKPEPRLVKKRIEALIDREYLERGDKDGVYNYKV